MKSAFRAIHLHVLAALCWSLSACGDLDCSTSEHDYCLPDLVVSDFQIGTRLSMDASTYRLCVEQPNEYLTIKNDGPRGSAAYRAAITLFDFGQSQIVGGCVIPVPAGTPAGELTTLANQGCCTIAAKLLSPERQYLLLLMADAGQEVHETDEDNNLYATDPFFVTGLSP